MVAAYAAVGDIVASYPAPAANPTDLAAGGGFVYCYTAGPPYTMWKINPVNGAAVSSSSFPFFNANTVGLAFDGNYFWAGNAATDYIVRFTTAGSIVSSFKTAWDFGYGLGWSDVHLWGSEQMKTPPANYLYEMRVDGVVVQSLYYYYAPFDVGWDGRYLWTAVYDAGQTVSKITAVTTTGTAVKTLASPAAEARGVAYDGSYLWVSTLANNGWLWKINVAGLAVTPASWGKVKAVYR
jgi:hypothetical protein